MHILDRYHIVANLNKAIDSVRREEVIKLRNNGYKAVLSKTRWNIPFFSRLDQRVSSYRG